MSNQVIIALDAMGGDYGADVVVPAAVCMLQQESHLRLVLAGDESNLQHRLTTVNKELLSRLEIRHASQVVDMDESPSHALRSKKDSSMRVAINLVKSGDAGACVSAGNTGALIATARFVLKTLPGIARPALCTAIPCMQGHTHMLDLGGNVDCTKEHLFQFAVMGTELVAAISNIKQPMVALLNIGAESMKGNEQVKEAAVLLANSPLNYIGFIEADDVYKGKADVVVADGFIGNIALKSSEGVAKMITFYMREAFTKNIFTRLAGLLVAPVMRSFRAKIDPRNYNGASLLGLKGIVVKSHGSADIFAFSNAIKIAMLEVEKAVPQRISQSVETLLAERH